MRLDHLLSKEWKSKGMHCCWSGESRQRSPQDDLQGAPTNQGFVGKRSKREAACDIGVAIRNGETPVPIPNTTVKTDTAESTLLETAREDRWLPHQNR